VAWDVTIVTTLADSYFPAVVLLEDESGGQPAIALEER